ncbi:MAG: M16 family peptidase [Ktedonobacterales bacterium]|jgi:predicted Zn-dependent peptidase|nr:MAG: M16 family peptidase [Ktedonobacterales bacterium]
MTTPRASSTSSVLAPNYFLHTFPNGLQMVGQFMPSLASVTFGIQFGAGLKDEPEEKLGLTHLLSDMVFQGTESRNVRQLTEDFEAIGARKGGETANEFARYSAQIVGNRLDRALELMADVVRHPVFPAEEFEQMRSVQLQEIRRRDDEPMRRIFDLVRERFYVGTTLGRRALGLRETVEQLTPDDLRAFWQTYYRPSGALISIAGNFNWEHVVSRVGELFGDWDGTPPARTEQMPNPVPAVNIEIQEGQQEHIGMAFPFPKYGDSDYYAATVVSEIFGGGMTSRLFREVREKRGLVYSVASIFAPNGTSGAEFLYAGTTPEKSHETVQVMIEELRLLGGEGVTEDELGRAKVQLKSELVMRGESAAARMSALARSWWFEQRLIPIHELKEAIDTVTREQILGLLKRFPTTQPLVIAAIGPRTQDELLAGVQV